MQNTPCWLTLNNYVQCISTRTNRQAKYHLLVITCKERAKERIRYPKYSYNWSYDNNLKLKRRVDRSDGLISVTYDIDTQICFVS